MSWPKEHLLLKIGDSRGSEITPLRRGKAHGTPASPLKAHLIKEGAVGYLLHFGSPKFTSTNNQWIGGVGGREG